MILEDMHEYDMDLEESLRNLSQPIVVFAIPLKSEQVSSNWSAVQDRLRDTLAGIRSQTDKNCIAVICGHEKPNLEGFEDLAVWLPVDWPAPASSAEFSNDKTRKRTWIVKSVRPYLPDGAYVFLLDADDLISPRIVEHIRTDHNRQGYYVKKGYLWDQETGDVARNRSSRDFYQHCGSCGAVWLEQAELPRQMGDKSVGWSHMGSHHRFVADWEAQGKTLTPFPFASLIYLLNHGQNNTQVKQNAKGTIQFIESHALDEKKRAEVFRSFRIARPSMATPDPIRGEAKP